MSYTLYGARRNSDQIEGRGPLEIFAVFTERADAVAALEGQGPMGTDENPRTAVKEIVVYQSLAEWQSTIRNEARRKALAKLTSDERALLGLKDV